MFPQMVKVETVKHGEHIRPLGGGRARLLNVRCDSSLVERPVLGVHRVVAAVDSPHEPPESQDLGD